VTATTSAKSRSGSRGWPPPTTSAAGSTSSFLGSGEFTLEFGNYKVRITVPDDHIVASTGVLQNPQEVLTAAQLQRLEQAKTATTPVLVVTPAEARAAEAGKADRPEDLGVPRRERPRLRVRLVAQVHLGRAGPRRREQPGDGDVVLP
jgi:hypothetical protein